MKIAYRVAEYPKVGGVRLGRRIRCKEEGLWIRELRGEPILLQTPQFMAPFGITTFSGTGETSVGVLDLGVEGNEEEVCGFEDWVEALENRVRKLVRIERGERWRESIRSSEDRFYPALMRVKVARNRGGGIGVFDPWGGVIEEGVEGIVPQSWVTGIVYPKHVWYREEVRGAGRIRVRWGGLTWYLLQARVKRPIPILASDRMLIRGGLGENLCQVCYQKIIGNKEGTGEGIGEGMGGGKGKKLPEEYEKYVKMLKLGIPLLGVIQKCQMDGLDPKLLEQVPKLLFGVGDLKVGLGKLKKVKEVEKVKRVEKVDPRVPSLGMILESLRGLKRTGVELI